jgi:hypothetical protein
MMFADPFASTTLFSCFLRAHATDTHGWCRQIGKSAISNIGCAAIDLIADSHVGNRRMIGKLRALLSTSRAASPLLISATHP